MRIIYRDNYTPQIGDYHERIIIDGAQGKQWLFDCDGVYTDMAGGVEIVNEKGQATNKAVSQKLFTDEINDEANARSEADRAIWEEIEDIEASSDVTDIVGTHADLENYDTSKLNDNDIIKVLVDETQDDKITYYRWDEETDTFTLVGAIGPYYTETEADNKFQDKLTAGANILIDANNEISATDTTYTAGTNITIDSDNVISAVSYTAGANVSIDANNVISATDTTYSDFVGTDGQVAGTAGLVPAPATTDADKYLKSDGTWATVAAGPTIVQTTGTSQTDVMSQVATSQLIYPSGYEATKNRIVIGSGASVTSTTYTGQIAIGVNAKSFNDSAIAIGSGSIASGSNPYHWGLIAIGTGAASDSLGGVAIGYGAKSNYQYSVALGAESKPRERGVVDVSTSTYNHGYQGTNDQSRTDYRVISGVHDGEQLHDAATVAQGNTLSVAAPTSATVGVVGQLLTDTSGVALYQCTAVNGGSYTWEKVGAKLYTTTGQNTDGAVTQKLFTDTVGDIETALQILNSGAGVP